MPRISFLVPTFNRARYLAEALDSILVQMGAGDELLVIDDGSTDETTAVLATYGTRIRAIRQENAGKAAALNRGMTETTGRYVWICDDDDVLRPGAVDLLVDALEHSGAGFVFGRYTRFAERDGNRVDLGTGYWPDLQQGNLVRHILEDAFVMQNSALVRREAYDMVGPFSTAMLRSLDYEMFVRLAVAMPCRYVDAVLFDQRKHDGVRGPVAMLHAAAASDNVWLEFDRRIFENLHRSAPPSLFEAMFDAKQSRRAGLLQRGTIMARHACWAEALADFEAAAELRDGPLDAGEAAICQRALAGKHLFATLAGAPELRGFRRLARSPVGGQIVKAMFAGCLWRIRRGSAEERRVTLAALRTILGVPGALALVARHAFGRSLPANVTERTAFPPEHLLGSSPLPPVTAQEAMA